MRLHEASNVALTVSYAVLLVSAILLIFAFSIDLRRSRVLCFVAAGLRIQVWGWRFDLNWKVKSDAAEKRQQVYLGGI